MSQARFDATTKMRAYCARPFGSVVGGQMETLGRQDTTVSAATTKSLFDFRPS